MLILNAHAGHVLALARVQLVIIRRLLNFSLTVDRLTARDRGRRGGRGSRGSRGSFAVVHARWCLGRASFGYRARLIFFDIHLLSNSYSRFGRRFVRPTALRSWQLWLRQRVGSDRLLLVLAFTALLRGQI